MTVVRPDRWGYNSLLLTAGLALAPHVAHLPLWIMLTFAAAFAWRFAIENRGWPRPGAPLRLGLTLLVVAATYEHYGTFLGRDAASGLLVSLLALKFLELRKLRDCVVALFLCYLLLLASFLFSQSPVLALYSLMVVAASMAALIRLNQPSGVSFAFSLRLAGVMMLKAVPLMLAMFLLFPRIQGTLWGLTADVYSGLTGMSEVMQPGSVRHLSTSSAPAFRVEFDGQAPQPSRLYWRGIVLWHTNGQRWTRGPAMDVLDARLALQHLGAPVKYTVTLEPSNKPWMLALDLPVVVPLRARSRPGHVLEHGHPIRERLRYTLVSYPRYDTGPLGPLERKHALQLPARVSARVRALAHAWRQPARDDLAVARAALDYFRREPFVYTLNPPVLGVDPVDEFLFSIRRGFCGHFASAFVTLMRAAGVPSRIVQGYQGGEFNPAGNYWIVRQADAHAWAEIWLSGRGWVRVDPTAVVAPERVELGIDAVRRLELQGVELGRLSAEAVRKLIERGWFAEAWRTMRLYWDAANLVWHRSVLGYDQQRQQLLLDSLRLPRLSWQGLLAALGAVVIFGLLVLALATHHATRIDPAQACYRSFCGKLARIGIRRGPAEGALAFAERATSERPDLKPTVATVTELYLRIRYASLAGQEYLRTLKRLVAEFRPSTR